MGKNPKFQCSFVSNCPLLLLKGWENVAIETALLASNGKA
jgi:hypothetical protein